MNLSLRATVRLMTDIGGAADGSQPGEPSPVADIESRALLLRKVPIAVGGVLAIAQLPGEIKAYKTGVAMIAAWVDAIKAQAHGVPPDGLKIHKPWGTVKTVLVVVAGATVLVVGSIVLALVLTSK